MSRKHFENAVGIDGVFKNSTNSSELYIAPCSFVQLTYLFCQQCRTQYSKHSDEPKQVETIKSHPKDI